MTPAQFQARVKKGTVPAATLLLPFGIGAVLHAAGAIVAEERWLSIGGGFVQREDEEAAVVATDWATPPCWTRSRP